MPHKAARSESASHRSSTTSTLAHKSCSCASHSESSEYPFLRASKLSMRACNGHAALSPIRAVQTVQLSRRRAEADAIYARRHWPRDPAPRLEVNPSNDLPRSLFQDQRSHSRHPEKVKNPNVAGKGHSQMGWSMGRVGITRWLDWDARSSFCSDRERCGRKRLLARSAALIARGTKKMRNVEL